jgi:nitroimidazol reductase NimA-like FMN-containing flavoprotein (pyridoxamine 5'-phosphate oxidase superfamily)
MTPSIEIETLDETECLDLLRSQPVGRIVFTENALPAIRPVNFLLEGKDVIIRTSGDAWLPKVGGSVVAFEVDQIYPQTSPGWSVVGLGKAEVVTDIDALVRWSEPAHRPWAPGVRDRFLRIRAGEVSGRRLALKAA